MSAPAGTKRWPRRVAILVAAVALAELALRWVLLVPAEHVLAGAAVRPVLDWFRRPGR